MPEELKRYHSLSPSPSSYLTHSDIQKYEELEKDLNKLDADTANARYAFALFDADDSGFINKEELKHMLKLMHKDDSEQNVQQLSLHKISGELSLSRARLE